MKKFKDVIITVLGVGVFVAGFCILKPFSQLEGILEILPYLMIGIGCGAFGYGTGEIVSKWAMKKDPELAKQIEIDKKDERNVMLANKAKAKAFGVASYVFSALLLAYVFMGAQIEIIIPFVIAYIFIQFYAVYVRVKIEKKN